MYMPLAVLSKIVPIVSRPKRASHGHRLDARFNGLVGSFVGWATLRYGTVFLALFFCWASAQRTPHQFKAVQFTNGHDS